MEPRKSAHCCWWSSVRPGVSLMTRRLRKGTFKVRIQVKSAGNTEFRAGKRTVTVKIRVK